MRTVSSRVYGKESGVTGHGGVRLSLEGPQSRRGPGPDRVSHMDQVPTVWCPHYLLSDFLLPTHSVVGTGDNLDP